MPGATAGHGSSVGARHPLSPGLCSPPADTLGARSRDPNTPASTTEKRWQSYCAYLHRAMWCGCARRHLDLVSARFQQGYDLLAAAEIDLVGRPSDRASLRPGSCRNPKASPSGIPLRGHIRWTDLRGQGQRRLARGLSIGTFLPIREKRGNRGDSDGRGGQERETPLHGPGPTSPRGLAAPAGGAARQRDGCLRAQPRPGAVRGGRGVRRRTPAGGQSHRPRQLRALGAGFHRSPGPSASSGVPDGPLEGAGWLHVVRMQSPGISLALARPAKRSTSV